MAPTELRSLDGFEESIRLHERVMLFKHSPICPVSASAHEEWSRFLEQHPDAPTLFVDVIARRPVARGLAESCGVAHESPQVILFVDGLAVWHASHQAIAAEALARAWSER